MRVMVIVKATKDSEAGLMPTPRCSRRWASSTNNWSTPGIMLAGDGLKPSKQGKRVAFDGPSRTVIDGPFAETRELVAGYWVWEVKDMAEAVEWVKRCPNPMPGPSEIEIRPVLRTGRLRRGAHARGRRTAQPHPRQGGQPLRAQSVRLRGHACATPLGLSGSHVGSRIPSGDRNRVPHRAGEADRRPRPHGPRRRIRRRAGAGSAGGCARRMARRSAFRKIPAPG